MKSPLRLVQWLLVALLLCNLSARAQQVAVTSITPNPACAGATITVTYSYTLPDPGSVILYLNGPNTTNLQIGTATTNGDGGSVQGTIPADRATGSYTVFIRRTSNILPGSTNSPASSAFTVNARPVAPGVANLAYCQGATGVPPLTATGQNLKWYTLSAGGTGSTTAPTPPNSATGTTNYYVSQTSTSGCEGPRATLAVTVTPRPGQPTVVSSVSYCQHATAASLATAVIMGLGLKWYTTPTGGTGSSSAPTPPTSVANTITYYVSQKTTINGCESDRAAITVTIKASPPAPAVLTPVAYCQGQPATPLSATPVSGGTLNWFGTANNSLGSTAPTPPTTIPGTTFYTVSQTVSGCTSSTASITVIVNTRPVAPTTRAVSVCQGTTPISLETGVTSGSNLRWYTSAMGGTGSTVAPTPATSSTGTTSYYVSQIDGNGCESDRAVVSYTVNPTPGAPTVSSSPLQYCLNSTAVPLTATPVPNTTLSYYTVATGGTPYSSLTPSTSASNNYYVSQTLNNCEGPRATISVVINALPARPAVTTPVTYCQFATADPLSAIASANNTLNWYGIQATGGTASTVAPTPPTTTDGAFTYYVSQKDPNGCESDRAPIRVTINPKPAVPVSTPASACLNSGPYSLAQAVTATGTLNWYTASTGGTGSTDAPVLPTSAEGSITYYVSQTSGSGCESDRVPVTFTINPLPIVNLSNDGPSTCTKPVVLLVASSTGSGGLTYRFSTGANQIGNGPTATVNTAGVYSVTAVGSNGCSSVASTTVTGDQTAPSVNINPSSATLTCTNPSATLTAVGTGRVSWNTGAQTTTITATTAGTYSVTLTAANGCVATASAVITGDQTAPTVNISPTSGTLTCASPTLTLTANTTAPALSWSNGQTTPSITVNASGTYSVTATGSNGCSATSNQVLIESSQTAPPATLIASGSGILTCAVTSVTLTANTGSGLSYRFSSGATQLGSGNTATVNVAGTYSVTVTNTATGCTNTANVVVNQDNSQPTVSINPTTATLGCAQPSVVLTASSSASSLAWSSGQTTASISVSVAGTYSVTVSSAGGCSAVASATVTGDQNVPTASLTNNGPLTCSTTSVTLTASGGSTYQFGAGANQIGSGPTATVSQAGVYSVTVVSVNGCSAVASTTVTGDVSVPMVNIQANPSLTITQGQSTLLTASATGSQPLTYAWSTSQTTPTISVSTAGPYSVTVASNNGCTATASVVISVTTTPVVSGPFALTGVSMVSCTPLNEFRKVISFQPLYNGLTGAPVSFSVDNELAATTDGGPYNLQLYTDNPTITLRAVQSGVVSSFVYNWLAACNSGVTPPPSVTNTAPMVVNSVGSQAALLGQAFTLSVAGVFTDAQTPGALTLSAAGLPAGLSLMGTTISGTPSATGTTTVTLTATDPGNLSANTSFGFTITAPTSPTTSPGSFALAGVSTISCTPIGQGRIDIRFTPQYTGLDGSPVTFSVANELAPTTAAGPYSLQLYTDNPTITLRALQSGVTSSFSYNWLAACQNGGNPTPTPGNTAPRVAQPVSPQSTTVGQSYTLNVASVFTDTETPNNLVLTAMGLPAGLSLTGTTISGTPSVSGMATVTLTATDPGNLTVSTSFGLTVSPTASVTMSPPSGFTITSVQTLSCVTLGGGQRSVSFVPQYGGTNGQGITFWVVNELAPTSSGGPYTLRLYTDNPVLTLKAIQAGSEGEVSYRYNWLAACGSSTRVGAEELESRLQVRLLGNPVSGQTAEVEILGVAGQAVALHLVDMQGRPVHTQHIELAGAQERVRIPLGNSSGILLLRVSTANQHQQVKLMRIN